MALYTRRINHSQINPRSICHPQGIGTVNTNGIGRSSTGSQFDNVRPFKIIIIPEITVKVSQNGIITLRDPGNILELVILQGRNYGNSKRFPNKHAVRTKRIDAGIAQPINRIQ